MTEQGAIVAHAASGLQQAMFCRGRRRRAVNHDVQPVDAESVGPG